MKEAICAQTDYWNINDTGNWEGTVMDSSSLGIMLNIPSLNQSLVLKWEKWYVFRVCRSLWTLEQSSFSKLLSICNSQKTFCGSSQQYFLEILEAEYPKTCFSSGQSRQIEDGGPQSHLQCAVSHKAKARSLYVGVKLFSPAFAIFVIIVLFFLCSLWCYSICRLLLL